MKKHQLGMTGLLACASLFAWPAAAPVQSSATVSNLRFVLIDLAPDDGETPWFRFTDTELSPMSVSSSVTPRPGSEQHAFDSAERSGYFEFSPNTRLSLVLDLHLDMQAGPSLVPEQYGNVWAVFRGGATWGPPKDSWERRDGDDIYGDVGLYNGSFIPRVDRNATLSLDFWNESAYAATGDFNIMLESTSHAMAAPVPEAPAATMWVLGAGVLGFLGRRRTRARTRTAAAA